MIVMSKGTTEGNRLPRHATGREATERPETDGERMTLNEYIRAREKELQDQEEQKSKATTVQQREAITRDQMETLFKLSHADAVRYIRTAVPLSADHADEEANDYWGDRHDELLEDLFYMPTEARELNDSEWQEDVLEFNDSNVFEIEQEAQDLIARIDSLDTRMWDLNRGRKVHEFPEDLKKQGTRYYE